MDLNNLCLGCFEEIGKAEECPHCGFVKGTPAESPVHLPPGTILYENYLIGRVIDQGGFGITYLSWDINLNLKSAIKEYYPQDLATRAAGQSQISAYTGNLSSQFQYGLEKFLQEAQTLAQFEGHPGVVSVRHFFEANGTAYIVMSYIEGTTLKNYLKDSGNKLPFEKALKIIMPVLDTLKELHAVNVLHRDISPDNIYINKKGQVILIDFGAARHAIVEKGRSLSIVLKPGYTPEEQYRSKGIQGPWTDIYAVAATFYRAITGQMPPESLDRLEQDTLVPPSQLGIEITKSQEKALLKAMAVKAADRFQTVKEFQNALSEELPGVEDDDDNEGKKPSQIKIPLLVTAVVMVFALILLMGDIFIQPNNDEQTVSDNTTEFSSVSDNTTELPEPEPVEPEEEPVIYDTEDLYYIITLLDVVEKLENDWKSFDTLMEDPTFTDEWIAELAFILISIDNHIQDVRNLKTTELFSEAHFVFLKSMDEYEQVVEKLIIGIADEDVVLIEEAAYHLLKGADYMDEAIQLMESILEEEGTMY